MIVENAAVNGGRCQLFNASPLFWFYVEPNVTPSGFNNTVFRFLAFGEKLSRMNGVDSNELITVKGRVAETMKVQIARTLMKVLQTMWDM